MSNPASKKTLIIMVAVFVLPVILAKLALENDWFNQGATNKGALLQPTIDVSSLLEGTEPKWRLLYVLPESCDVTCENALFSINQVWLALGKESDRAQALVLFTEKSDVTALEQLSEYANVHTLSVSGVPITNLKQQSVYIVDTLNNAMLYYQIDSDRSTAVMESRSMLADIKKLLKLSRIG
ncbi:conserved hypothetical protein [Alteromonas sp. 38]|uniref:hypothetical protein n=1 Tax=Alteromonas TaxID=226 RepID=UPI0012F0B84E|nr:MULTISPECIES: hypothetical protein [Alteromonas]CAD5247132.1 conserved hypothetical protein [Alteromonas sp. 154]VXC55101.1 conserved hypothetical protein [Alteromonas sp. 38]